MSAIRRILPRGPIEWKKALRRLVSKTRTRVLVRFVLLFVCLTAMFMTNSRGGTLVSLVVLVLTFLAYFWDDLPGGRGLFAVLVGCIVTALVVLQIIGGHVSDRLDVLGFADEGRLKTYRSTLKIIFDHPWFGTGLGTFAAVFPGYRSGQGSMWGVWDMAHSTPLEFASEMGIPLTVIVGGAWIAVLVVMSLAVRGRQRGKVALLASLAVSLIALVHSLIDFSLQITGYSIVVFALLGVGLSQAVNERTGSGKSVSVNLDWRKSKSDIISKNR